MIRCQTLGPLMVTVDGAPAPPELLWRKHLALLIVLARAARRTRAREQLTGLLWSEKAESAARHSLNEALRVIRRSAGDDALETRGDQVTLDAAVVTLDVEELDRRASEGDLAGAAALATGEFLEGFAIPGVSEFENWLSSERRHWAARCVAVLSAWSEAEAATGRLGSALAAAERALTLDPLAESAMVALLRALVLQGERASALSRYETHAALVRERLGAEPSNAVRALAERIRADRSRTARPAALTSPAADRRRVPLVGRESELGALLETWREAASTRQARAALVMCDPGMGRTRLAEELASRVRLDGAVVVHARAVSADRDLPGSGLVALASGELPVATGVAAAPPEAVAELCARVPAWTERFGSREGRVAAPETSALSGALIAVLRAVADESPVLIWVDDAHFLDATSFGFLERVPRDLSDLPVMLLVGASTQPVRDEVDHLRARMGREVRGTTLVPGPLDEAAVRGLAAWALPAYAPSDLERLVRRLTHDTAGLPLLLVELLDAVADGLDLERQSSWPQPFRTLDQTLPGDLPDSITAAIRISFRRLGSDAQKVLGAASVLGDRVQPGDLAIATGLPQAAVLDALDELEWTRWLVAESRGYGFLARIVRDIIARDMLTPGQRKRITESVSG